MKNTTLYLKFYEKGKPGSVAFNAITPLFDMKVYKINLNKTLPQITNNPYLNYTPRKTDYDRILIINADMASNARRSVLLNNKRNDLIQFLNKFGLKSHMYVIQLNQINNFVPTKYLIQQLKVVLEQKRKKQQSKNVSLRNFTDNIINYRHKVLFPFNYTQWKILLKQIFPKYKSINYYKLQQNYLFMQISNFYMIQNALNPKLMYEDLRDFDAFLSKFNFIRYFWQACANNQFLARKHSERLIKSLKWRTQQSEQYLLFLMRANNWERFILMVQDFCLSYQSIYGKQLKNEQDNQ